MSDQPKMQEMDLLQEHLKAIAEVEVELRQAVANNDPGRYDIRDRYFALLAALNKQQLLEDVCQLNRNAQVKDLVVFKQKRSAA